MSRAKHPGPIAPSRRELLAGGAALAALTGCGEEPSPEPHVDAERPGAPEARWAGAAPEKLSAFPEGVQSGDPLPDRVLIWTRAASPGPLTVHLARWDGAAWVEDATFDADPDEDGYLHLDIDTLPDEFVSFQLVNQAGEGSGIGLTRSAPAIDAKVTVSFGAISCCDQDHGEMPALEVGRALGPMDFFLWLGDTVYADGARSLASYRQDWRNQFSKRSFRQQFAEVPSIFTWDDHEVGNNWDPETIDPGQLAAAKGAFFETIPLRANPEHPERLWRSFRFGQTVELFVIDCRGERKPSKDEYLSREQLAWLIDGINNSTATWKVIANSVPIADMPPAWDIQDQDRDRWEGYRADRAALLDGIQSATGVFFVSGDFHQTAIIRVDPEGPNARLLDILAGPGGSFLNPAGRLLEDGLDNQFIYSDADWSAAQFTCRPDGTATVVMAQEGGEEMVRCTFDTAGNVLSLTSTHPWETA